MNPKNKHFSLIKLIKYQLHQNKNKPIPAAIIGMQTKLLNSYHQTGIQSAIQTYNQAFFSFLLASWPHDQLVAWLDAWLYPALGECLHTALFDGCQVVDDGAIWCVKSSYAYRCDFDLDLLANVLEQLYREGTKMQYLLKELQKNAK